MTRATGADDPALDETSWPLPDKTYNEDRDDLQHALRYGTPTRSQLLQAAAQIAAYRALVCDGTTTQQTGRLAALRRVWRRKR